MTPRPDASPTDAPSGLASAVVRGPGADATAPSVLHDVTGACGVYVHVPFCRRRCPYCDFAFEVRAADARFVPAVLEEVAGRAHELPGVPASLSLGGGTPSALAAVDLAALVAGVRARTGLAPAAEVSLELNPEDVDAALARALADAGFTRASLGVQSFHDDVLRWLGRAHDGARARAAVAACVAAGLATGVDLIVGVPGEGAPRLAADVEAAVALGAGHVSTYLLTVEPGTPLVTLIRDKKREAPDDEAQADAYEAVQALLAARGLTQYEVSSFAMPGHESRHNRLYWQGGVYLGVGPSAHSMRRRQDGSVLRRHTTARLDGWLPAPLDAAHDEEVLPPAAAFREAVAFGLRDLGQGVDLDELAARHRVGAACAERVAQALERMPKRVVKGSDGRLRLTREGARFADGVARSVLAAHDDQR